MPGKIYIETYGCQMNDYESDRTLRHFREEGGYEPTEDPAEADVVLFNTCSIREKADQKAFSSLGKLRVAKMARPEMVIAVGGCMAQLQADEIVRRAPFVDLVFGTHQWTKLPALVEAARKEKKQTLETEFYGWRDYSFFPYKRSTSARPICDVVTVQNGCDKFCTFCLVPFTRGREMSRPIEEIVTEIQGLAEEGVREVMLLGQNVNAYGTDRRGEPSFAELLRRVAEVDGLERIRFMTSHPAEFSESLIDALAEIPKVCEHIHLPLQSGSDRVLARMNRGYTFASYRQTLSHLRKRMPGVSVTTDVIVGFPAETDADFEQTMAALDEFDFDDSFSFCFSPRPQTKAAAWTDEFVPSEVAAERLTRYQSRQQSVLERRLASLVGTVDEVLIDGNSKYDPKILSGRTRTNRTVNLSGPADWIGRKMQVRITAFSGHTLRGEAA